MTSKPRGYCLIFNNYDFSIARKQVPELQDLKDRTGTDFDAGTVEQKRNISNTYVFVEKGEQKLYQQGHMFQKGGSNHISLWTQRTFLYIC